MKKVFGLLGAGIVGTLLLASPANAACAWNGYAWHCWNGHRTEISGDRARLRAERQDVRHDRRHTRYLHRKLNRDMHYGNSTEVVRDVHKLQRTHSRLRNDRVDVHSARQELRYDRGGY